MATLIGINANVILTGPESADTILGLGGNPVAGSPSSDISNDDNGRNVFAYNELGTDVSAGSDSINNFSLTDDKADLANILYRAGYIYLDTTINPDHTLVQIDSASSDAFISSIEVLDALLSHTDT